MCWFLALWFGPSHQNSQFLLFEHLCRLRVWVDFWLYDSAPHTRIPNFSCLFICVGYMYELIFVFMIRPLTPHCQFCLIVHLCGLCVWVPIWLYDSAPHTRIPTFLFHLLCSLSVWVDFWLWWFSPSHQNVLFFLFVLLCMLGVWVDFWLYDSAPHTRIPTYFVSYSV
jgi:hypothetical protein